MARRAKKSSSVKINFKGVESRKTPPEGDYVVEVLEAVSGESKASGGDQIAFTLEIAKGEYKGTKLYFYCPLAENSLWKLHAFLTALGEEVPEEEMDIDLDELVGKQCVGVLTHETYNGRKRAKMTDFDSLDNYKGGDEDEDDDDDDKKSSKKSKKGAADKKSSKKSKSEDEDDDDEPKKKGKKSKSEDDDDEDEPKSKKKGKGKSKSDDDDEDEDEKPKKGAKSKDKGKKKPKKYDKDDVEDMDEDELEEVIKESGIDVDLDDYKKLSKKVAAVVDALEEADLLDE